MSLYVSAPRRASSRHRDHSQTRAPSPPRQSVISKLRRKYESESESSESSSDDDRRDSRQRTSRHDSRTVIQVAEPRRHRDSSPGHEKRYTASAKPVYNSHPNYAELPRYEHARPSEIARHTSYGSDHKSPPAHSTIPGEYKWEYDHSESHERPHHAPDPYAGHGHPEQTRHMSINTPGFHMEMGSGHPQQYAQQHPQYAKPPLTHSQSYGQPMSPTHGQYAPQYAQQHAPQYAQPARPDSQRHHSGSIVSGHSEYKMEYAKPERFQYEAPQNVKYTSKPAFAPAPAPTQVLEVKPGRHGHSHDHSHEAELSSRTHRLSVSTGLGASLSVNTNHGHDHSHGALPPGSPLLEAYHGTYQSISPMPSPMMLASHVDEGLSDLEQLDSKSSSSESSSDSSSRHGHGHGAIRVKPVKPKKSILKKTTSKTVKIYDPEEDALALASALKHTTADLKPIVHILPPLSSDNIIALRTEYKKHMKVGGKGINIAKHIKMKVPGNLGKIAYATALGRWESEAHWANFWYQSGTSRRELLIESLMGRTNAEIRAIKDAFSDKRYNDSLEKCMQVELKKDKFRNAVLLALEERRMEEYSPSSGELIQRDVRDLAKALSSKEGGETAMINIIVVRSDGHLRDVLKEFERVYKKNFAREMIQKSRNLVVGNLSNFQPLFQMCLGGLTWVMTGRDTGAHPQRRNQPACAGCASLASSVGGDIQGSY